jgi:5-methylcytosine-specific restriction enzyme A
MGNDRYQVAPWQRLYKTPAWRALRRAHLRDHPLCVMCERQGIICAGSVADHVIPHRGDRALFFNPRNLQTLCATHHNQTKQSWEKRNTPEIGADGWPVDMPTTIH